MRGYFTAVLLACVAMTASAQMKEAWKQAESIVSSIGQTSFPDRSVSITEYGARAGEGHLVHEAINMAIIDMSRQGGGTVVIPDSVYYTGPVTLKSNVRLHLSDKAVLRFSTDANLYFPAVRTRWEGLDCYNTHPLIYAYGETNIALTGHGTIDAQGSKDNWWGTRFHNERYSFKLDASDVTSVDAVGSRLRLLDYAERELPVYQRIFGVVDGLRPQLVNFCFCSRVLIEDVTLLNSPFWVMHPLFCNDVTVRGVTVKNDGPNGDGCDPESCKNVLIENCVFHTGDDCIAIKSGRNKDGRKWNVPSENIVIRNCRMADGHGGIVVGSEISGGYRNLYVENCEMDSPRLERVIRIKTSTARGGVIENIYVRNIRVGQCKEAVLRINLNYEPKEPAERGFDPTVRNVYIEGLTCQKSKYGIHLSGLKDKENIYNINLKDVTLNGVETGGNHVDGKVGQVSLESVRINGNVTKRVVSVD